MSDPSSDVIRGGIPGRERLRVLSRIVHESTARLPDCQVFPASSLSPCRAGQGRRSLVAAITPFDTNLLTQFQDSRHR